MRFSRTIRKTAFLTTKGCANGALNVKKETAAAAAAASCTQSQPQVVQFTLSHFRMQEERCRLSEMKKSVGC